VQVVILLTDIHEVTVLNMC